MGIGFSLLGERWRGGPGCSPGGLRGLPGAGAPALWRSVLAVRLMAPLGTEHLNKATREALACEPRAQRPGGRAPPRSPPDPDLPPAKGRVDGAALHQRRLGGLCGL